MSQTRPMRWPSRLTLVATFALAGVSPIWAAPDFIAFGSRTLSVPAPAGFDAKVSSIRPDALPLIQAYLPASNRLVEMYIADADAEAFAGDTGEVPGTYFQLQSLRSADGVVISSEDFTRQAGEMEQEFKKAFANVAQTSKELTDQGNQALKERTGSDPGLSLSGTEFLGVSRREPWGLFFNLRSTVSSPAEAGVDDEQLVTSGALLLVDHQLMYLYGYRGYNGPDDLEWTKKAVANWSDAVHTANPDNPALEADARTFGFDWAEIGNRALIGALVGGLIGLVLAIVRKRKQKS